MIDAFKDPAFGRVVSKAKKCIVGELNVPLNLLPAFFMVPPLA